MYPINIFTEKIRKTVVSPDIFDINKSDIEDSHDSDKDPDYHQPIGVDGMYICIYFAIFVFYITIINYFK